METYQAIANRQTIRDFDPRPIPPEIIHRLLEAGFNAPSNNHLREWHFILLQDKEKRCTLLEKTQKPISKRGAVGIINRWGLSDPEQRAMYIDAIPKQISMLLDAACLMLPCFRQEKPLLKPRDLSALNPFASIWCCVENMLIAASAEGIFGVTRIPFESERCVIKEELGLPGDYEFPCWLALGYPASDAVRARQVQIDLDERVHVDAW